MARAFFWISFAALLLTLAYGFQVRLRLTLAGDRTPASVDRSDFSDDYLVSYDSHGQHFAHWTRWKPEVGGEVVADGALFLATDRLFAPSEGEGLALVIFLSATGLGALWWRASSRPWEPTVLVFAVACLAFWSSFCFERHAYDTHFGNMAYRPGASPALLGLSAAIVMLQALFARTAARLHVWALTAATAYAFSDSLYGNAYPLFFDATNLFVAGAAALSVVHLAGRGITGLARG